MSSRIERILTFIQQSKELTDDTKSSLLKDVKEVGAEIIEKSGELKIEAALERLRAVAMGMNTPADLLNICKALFIELKSLQLGEVRNAIIHTYPGRKNYFIDYDYSDFNKAQVSQIPYTGNPIIEKFVKDIRRSTDAFTEIVITGNDLKQWQSFRDANNEIADVRLSKISSLYYYMYSIGNASIGISTFNPISADKQVVLKRFRNVFDLAYKRYTDIALAEAQARESKIQLALERVRAKTLAMQHSEELADTAAVLFEQFHALGEIPERMAIEIVNENEHVFEIWATQHGGSRLNTVLKATLDEPHVMQKMYKAWRSQVKSITIDLQGKELEEYFRFLQHNGMPVDRDKFGDRRVQNVATFSKGILTIITTGITPAETITILERFAAVFDGTYTRFLDLQKAETQAREAQIELALEHVRTQSMLMQHSKELDETLRVFHQQVLSLGIPSAFSFLWLPDEEKDRHIFWAAWAENNSSDFNSKAINYPLDRNEPATALCLSDWKSDEPVVSYHVEPAGVESYFAAWSELIAGVEQLKPEHFSEGLYYVEAFLKYGCFGVMVQSELKDGEKKILARFAIEFERAYTRFLDLQKAEAQAREAQIEAALERVRSRTMAMQKSDELAEAATLVFQQFSGLGLLPEGSRVFFSLIDVDTVTSEVWTTKEDGILRPGSHRISLKANKHLTDVYEYWIGGKLIYNKDLTGKELTDYLKYIASVPNLRDDKALQQAVIAPPDHLAFTEAFFAQGTIGVISLIPLTLESQNTLMRFSKVFEQTYTRFLDLQKAEAQAKEAQIETALERVRSRTMGMQKSDELKEVIQVVYDQFVHLNVHVEHTGFIIDYKEREDMHIWLADRHLVPFEVTIPYFDSPHWNSFVEAKAQGTDFFSNTHTFEEKNKFYQDLFEHVKGIPEDAKEYYLSCPGLAISTVLLDTVGLYIENFSGIPYSVEENRTLMRLGTVFQQTYTRFLDLKKAEAQAKEAKIETALERVRSRTMAMQHSRELAELVTVVFRELTQLDFIITSCIIWINKPELSTNELWVTSAEMDQPARPIFFTPFQHSYFNSIIHAWKQKDPKWIYSLAGEEKKSFEKWFFEVAPDLPEALKSALTIPAEVVFSASFNIFGALEILGTQSLTEEKFDILHRFGRVFDLGYTRFNDLIKAETQAREAQIELALERVRARTMAMQKSDELAETAALVFKQINDLGIQTWTSGFNIWENDDTSFIGYNPAPSGGITPPYHIPSKEDSFFINIYEAKKRGDDFFVFESAGKSLAETYAYMKTLPVVQEVLYGIEDAGIHLPTFQINHCSFFSHGFLLFITVEPYPNAHDIFKRFAKVFEQTYTRFLDLQKAEAYAEKAQIEEQKLRDEKKRSDSLLLNILPEEIANELKQFGKSYARKHEEVSILFSDIKGFSSISEELSAEELVMQLDECFRAFDKIIEKHGLEKIKTVGDAYICACGLPAPVNDNATKTVRAAMDMLNFLKGFNSSKKVQDLPAFEFRFGIHTGPVVTGVVGLKKFTYDIWGDAVNMAARMEQHGEAGKINVSGNTYQLIKEKFTCTHRGKIQAKNKGEVDMYFVDIVS